MSDTEILDWVLSRLGDGLILYPRNDWFIDGETRAIGWHIGTSAKVFKELIDSGRAVKRVVGYDLETDLEVDGSKTIGKGNNCREALLNAIAKELEKI